MMPTTKTDNLSISRRTAGSEVHDTRRPFARQHPQQKPQINSGRRIHARRSRSAVSSISNAVDGQNGSNPGATAMSARRALYP